MDENQTSAEFGSMRGEGVNLYVEETPDVIVSMIHSSVVEFCLSLAIVVAVFIFFQKSKAENRTTHFYLWAIALLASVPIFSDGLFLVADTEFHLMRIDAIYEGLKNGQFPVRVSGIFNMNHGLPVNIFYGDLFLYFPAVLRFFGFSLGLSYKFFVFAMQLFAVYVGHFVFVRIFQKRTLALVVTLLYVTAHFRLASFYMRSAVGEFSAQVLMPLILLAFWRLYSVDKPVWDYKNVIFLAVGMTAMIYAHIISTLLTCILLTIVAIFLYKKTLTKAIACTLILSAFLTLLLTAAFWVPFLDYYYNTFTELRALATFYTAFMQRNGANLLHFFNVFSLGEMEKSNFAISPGLCLLIGFFVAFYWVCFHKTRTRLRFVFVFSFLILWFSTALFPWDFLTSFSPFASFAQIQVPWRFLGFAVLALALLVGLLIEELPENLQQKALLAAVCGTVVSCCSLYTDYARQYRATIVPDAYVLRNFTGSTDPLKRNSGPEYIISGTQLDDLSLAPHFDKSSGKLVAEKGIHLFLHIDEVLGEGAYVEVPRFHYPYFYALTQQMQMLEIQTGTNNLMRIMLPRNFQGNILCVFVPPTFWHLAEAISLLTAILLMVFVVHRRQKLKNPR